VRRLYQLLWYNDPHTSPKIAPKPSPSFPRVGIHKTEIISQARTHILGDIESFIHENYTEGAEFLTSCFVQIKLTRFCIRERRPISCGVDGSRTRVGCCGGISRRDGSRDRGVVVHYEVAPDTWNDILVGLN